MPHTVRALVLVQASAIGMAPVVEFPADVLAATRVDGVDALRVAVAAHPPGHFDVLLLVVRDMTGSGAMLDDVRAAAGEAPILIIAGESDAASRTRLMEAGVEDVIDAACAGPELAVRIRSVLRRRRSIPDCSVSWLRLSLPDRAASWSGKDLPLTPLEFHVLWELARCKGDVVSRSTLLDRCWHLPFDPGTTVLEVQIARLRKKLAACTATLAIETVPGQGYRLAQIAEDDSSVA